MYEGTFITELDTPQKKKKINFHQVFISLND